MKKKFKLILIILTIMLMALSLFACTDNNNEPIDDGGNTVTPKPTYTVNNAVDDAYKGINNARENLDKASNYSVDTDYTIFTDLLNYHINYRANYKENAQDSEIYASIFDNENNVNRLTLYYDGKNLYLSSAEGNKYIKDFSYMSMFDNFFKLVRYLDITSIAFDEQIAALFDKNGTMNIVAFINNDNVSNVQVTETRDSVEFTGVDLTIMVDTVNNMLNRAHEGVGNKFDAITKNYFDFELGKILERAFETINMERLNLQRESDTVDRMVIDFNGKLKGDKKYSISSDIYYSTGDTIDVLGGETINKDIYSTVNLGKNKFTGTVKIPSISDDTFNMVVKTLLDSKENENNEMVINITDALNNNLINIYYRDQVSYLDIEGFENSFIKSGQDGQGAVDLSAFNLPKVYLEGVSLTNIINMIYNGGTRMLMEILDNTGNIPGSDNEDLYSIIMENLYCDDDVIYYNITEDLIKKLRQNEDEGVAEIIARALDVNVGLIDSIFGEDFFAESVLRISYDMATGEIGIQFLYKEKVEVDIELKSDTYEEIVFPADVDLDSYIYKKFTMPEDMKIEFTAELSVGSGQTSTDFSTFFGAFLGDISGKNTPFLLNRNDKIKVSGQISESFRAVSDGTVAGEYIIRLDFSTIIDNKETAILSVYTNPKNREKLVISYYMPLGNSKNKIDGGYKYQLDRSVIGNSIGKLVNKEGSFDSEEELVKMIKEIVFEGANNVQVLNTDGYYSFTLQATTQNGNKKDPLFELTGIENLIAAVKTRVVFTEVLLNDINTGDYAVPELDKTFNDAVQIKSLYDANSKWKDTVTVTLNGMEVDLIPNYVEESITVVDSKKQYNPQCTLFGLYIDYILNITSSTGTYRLKSLKTDTIIIDPAYGKKVPNEIEVLFENGMEGKLPCIIEGLTNDTISYAGLNREVFANEKIISYTLKIGKSSILEKEFTIYFAVHNRAVRPVVADDDGDGESEEIYDTKGVPCVGVIIIDPYTYAMKKTYLSDYNPIEDGITAQNMTINFDNQYGTDENKNPLYYNQEGYNYFYLNKLGLNWQFDESAIEYGGAVSYAYTYYGEEKYDDKGNFIGAGIKIALKVIVQAKTIKNITIGNETAGRYVIDSLKESTYVIPSECTSAITVAVIFNDGTVRKIKQAKPDGISNEEFFSAYIAVVLNWNVPDNYMDNVTLEAGARALFGGEQGNKTYAYIEIGTIGTNKVELTVEVPERKILNSEDSDSTGNAVGKITDNGDGTVTYDTPQSYVLSPIKFSGNGQKYEAFTVNPYDTESYLPTSIFLEVKQYSTGTNRIFTEYPVSWLTINTENEETNILQKDENGRFRLAHPNTEETYFYVLGTIGDGIFTETVRVRIRNLDSELKSITYNGMEAGQTSLVIDPYKKYNLPGGFIAVLESGEKVVRESIQWEVAINGIDNYLPVFVNTEMPYDTTKYDASGKYIFDKDGGSYKIRYILEATDSVLKQALLIDIEVPKRTIVSNQINIYAEGKTLSDGYKEINCFEENSSKILARLAELAKDDEKALTVGIGFDEARTNMILDRYNLYVEWNKAKSGESGYENSIYRIIDLLKNPIAGTEMTLKGTIFKDTINQQELAVKFSLSSLEAAYLTIKLPNNAEGNDIVGLPQKGTDGRIKIELIRADGALLIDLYKVFALTIPKEYNGSEIQMYADPTEFLEYIFKTGISVTYTSGVHFECEPLLEYGDSVSADDINKKIFGITDGLGIDDSSVTQINIAKLSKYGSAEFNLPLQVTAAVDQRISKNRNLIVEIFDENGENCGSSGYQLPKYVEISYQKSGKIKYYLDNAGWYVSDNYKELFGNADRESAIDIKLINVLSAAAVNYDFYYVLPLQPLNNGIEDNRYFYLNVYIPRKNIEEVYYDAPAQEYVYNIKTGYLSVENPYTFYDADAEFSDGTNSYKTGFDYTKLPQIIYPQVRTGKFVSTESNSFKVSWIPQPNAIRQEDFNSGIAKEEKRLLAVARIYSYYNDKGEHVYQEVKVYVEMEALYFAGIEYSSNGNVLNVVKDDENRENIIVIDPYNDYMGYNGDFVLPRIGLSVNFQNNERFVITADNEIIGYELLDKDKAVLAEITHIPYDYTGHKLEYDNLDDDGVYVRLKLYSGQTFILFVRILNRAIENVSVVNTVKDGGNLKNVELNRLYYIDPYNSRTHILPTTVEINFKNEASVQTLQVVKWEIYNGSTPVSINAHEFFYTQQSTEDVVEYAYFKNTDESCKGGIFKLVGYISMGKNDSGEDIGIQGFDVNLVVLNRTLKREYTTDYIYTDPIAGLLSDIGGQLNDDMFVDSTKYYAETLIKMGYSNSDLYANINDGLDTPEISWNRYESDSVVSYEGFSGREVTGYLYYANTNIDYLYNYYKNEVNNEYSVLIKSLTFDKYFMKTGDSLVPRNNYTLNTQNSLKAVIEKTDKIINGKTFDILLNKYYSSNKVNATYLENTLLRAVINDHPELENENNDNTAFKSYLYNQLLSQNKNGTITDGDKKVLSDWQKERNKFAGNYDGFTENLDIKSVTEYQILKSEMYDYCADNSIFTQEEREINQEFYNETISKLSPYINSSVWFRIYDKSSSAERKRMDAIIGNKDGAVARSNALNIYVSEHIKMLASYGEMAKATINAPKVSFENLVSSDSFREELDTFYFNIYNSLSLIDKVDAEFLENKEAIFGSLIEKALEAVKSDFESAQTENALSAFYDLVYAQIVNAFVPVDKNGNKIAYSYGGNNYVYDYTVDGKIGEAAKRDAAITRYIQYVREQAISHFTADEESEYITEWASIREAYLILGKTDIVAVMDEILSTNENNYTLATSKFKAYLQDEASSYYDEKIALANKKIDAILIQTFMENGENFPKTDSQVFEDIYGSLIGTNGDADTIYGLGLATLQKVYSATEVQLLEDKKNSSTASNKYLDAVYYFMYNSGANTKIRTVLIDIFNMKVGLDKAYDEVLSRISQFNGAETAATVESYYQNIDITKDSFSDSLSDEDYYKLKKAKVFYNLYSYHKNDVSQAKEILTEIYDNTLLDIKSQGYAKYISNLDTVDKETVEEERAKYNIKATAFDLMLDEKIAEADNEIARLQLEIQDYVDQNVYLYSQEIYNSIFNNGFVYNNDGTIINYLDITEEEKENIGRDSVQDYYDNYATEAEKNKIIDAGNSYGECIVAGRFASVYGLYSHLIKRYDLGIDFINKLTNIYYYKIINKAKTDLKAKIEEELINEDNPDDHTNLHTIDDYMILYNKYVAKFRVILKNSSADASALAEMADRYAYDEYKNNLFENYTNTYNAALLNIKNNKLTENAQKMQYEALKNKNSEDFDEILEDLYMKQAASEKQRNYNAYIYLKDGLIKQKTQIFDSVENEIRKRMGYSTVYESLAVDDKSGKDKYGFEQSDYEQISDYWKLNIATDSEAASLRNDSYINTLSTPFTDVLSLIEKMSYLIDNRDNYAGAERHIDAIIDIYYGFADKFLSLYSGGNDILKGFLDALKLDCQLGIPAYDMPKVNYAEKEIINIRAYVLYHYTFNKLMTKEIMSLEKDLFESGNIPSDDKAKQAVIDKYIAMLNSENAVLAAEYLKTTVKDNYSNIKFTVRDTGEMTDEELSEYNIDKERYVGFLQKIYDELLLTSENENIVGYHDNVSEANLLETIKNVYNLAVNQEFLDNYLGGISDYSDESYQTVFDRMLADKTIYHTFYVSDHVDDAEQTDSLKKKHYLIFDVQKLLEEGSSSQTVNKVRLTNYSKKDDSQAVFIKDGYRFIYPQIELRYLDFYNVTTLKDVESIIDGGTATVSSKYINKITIDPLNPYLPDKVKAYGVYTDKNGKSALVDGGMINITYDNIFGILTGNFDGNAIDGETGSYAVTAINDKGESFDIGLTVYYLNRTVEKYWVAWGSYAENNNLVGAQDTTGRYGNYYDLHNSINGTNKITINPTQTTLVDNENKTYILPNSFVGVYKSYASDEFRKNYSSIMYYYDVDWDLSGISYSLKGKDASPIKINGFSVDNGDGTYNKVNFDYTNGKTTIAIFYSADNTKIREKTFDGVPEDSIWNINFEVEDKAVDKIYVKRDNGEKILLAEFMGDNISGEGNKERWLVAENGFTVNPYFVELYDNLIIEVTGGEEIEIEPGVEWIYNSVNGKDHLEDIISGVSVEDNNRYIVVGFNYICETIWMKIMVDDIKIERPQVSDGNGGVIDGYIDGGTIYLLANTITSLTKEQQLKKFYSYLYYNFAPDASTTDWRKVPLTFKNETIRNIVLNKGQSYTDIQACLGSDLEYNITFNIEIIAPGLYAYLEDTVNKFVMYDKISMPVDSNGRVIYNSADMPQILDDKFVHIAKDGIEVDFRIISTRYDVVAQSVVYSCRYYADDSDEKLAGTIDGDKSMEFTVELPLVNYNYTNMDKIYFDENLAENSVYSWKFVNISEEDDAIIWRLGQEMTSGLLPKGKLENGTSFEFLWDLNDININKAMGESAYYTIKGYYYTSTAQWLYKELRVYIDRQDISDLVIEEGEDRSLQKTYDGNQYNLEINYDNVIVLREDGTKQILSKENYLIEYKIAGAGDDTYTTTYRPRNKGEYTIRVTVDDYNCEGQFIVNLKILSYKILGEEKQGGMGSGGLKSDIVFENADTNNIINYVYNGQPQGVKVKSGLPMVHVEFWPQTAEEKAALYTKYLPVVYTDDEVLLAKSHAFNDLLDKVSSATKVYMLNKKQEIKENLQITDDTKLNAEVFDALEYNLYISEVVPTITYKNIDNEVMSDVPVNSGEYIVVYSIDPNLNNGNYEFDSRTTDISVRLIINQPEVNYNIQDSSLVYNGKYQNAYISGLHDGNGNLPLGVTVTYTYKYMKNMVEYTVDKIRNVGTYVMTAVISGGQNYPDDTLQNITITIEARNLYIDIDEEKAESEYLANIVNYSKNVIFDGLQVGDNKDYFYQIKTRSDVQNYYILGKYPIYIDGFAAGANSDVNYTKKYSEETVEGKDGKEYYRLILKTALEEGNLYQYVEGGKYVYEKAIELFNNYNVFIAEHNDYTIYAEANAVIVNNDTELKAALNNVKANDSVTIYLNAIDNGNGTYGTYSAVTFNKNASVTLIGCYNAEKEIISKIEKLVVTNGEIVMRIMKFAGINGKENVVMGEKAGKVALIDCYFDGQGKGSKAIAATDTYKGQLMVTRSYFSGYSKAIELLGGNSEITDSSFAKNKYAVSIYTRYETYIRNCTFESNSEAGLEIDGDRDIIIMDNSFAKNNIGVMGKKDYKDNIIIQNSFEYNATDYKQIIYG